MGTISRNQFVGAMSFLSWEGHVEAKQNLRKLHEEQYLHWSNHIFDASYWSKSIHLFGSKATNWDEKGMEIEDDLDISIMNTTSKSSPKESTVETILSSNVAEGDIGKADVVCIEDCEVYSWSFKSPHDLLALEPSIGVVFEKSLAADLNKKMVGTWTEEPKLRSVVSHHSSIYG